MIRAKSGFHWKIIEQKPDNWGVLRTLIEDANNKKTLLSEETDHHDCWHNPLFFRLFINKYPEVKIWCDEGKLKDAPKIVNKGKKKQHTSLKHSIHQKLEEERIKKDLEKYRLNEKTGYIFPVQFTYDVNYLLFAVWWNAYFFHKKKANRLVLLDAILSLQRLCRYYKSRFEGKNEFLTDLVERAQKHTGALVKADMYTLLFENPKLLVETSLDRQAISKKLHPEQRRVLDVIEKHIMEDKPLLLGNQMPTGTGKTFLTIPLAKRLSSLSSNKKKSVLFCCSNELVCHDVASTCLLGDDLHLWMAKLIQDEDSGKPIVLLRPYKRCFPAKWKEVYKKTDISKKGSITDQWNFYCKATGRTPNVVVADLEAAHQILLQMPNPFIAYIDEFVSDEYSNDIMAQICTVLPRYTVLLSSILPKFEHLSHIVDNFCARHNVMDREQCIHRVTTADVNICCAVIDHNGYLRMPHHQCRTHDDIRVLVREIRVNPRIRRCYTPKHVYYWAIGMDDFLKTHELHFLKFFPDIGQVQTKEVLDYAVHLLEFLETHPEHLGLFQEYRPRIMQSPPSTSELFKSQAYYYEGKTLFISKDVFSCLPDMTDGLISTQFRLLQANTEKVKQAYDHLIDKLKKSKISKDDRSREEGDVQEMYTGMEIMLPPEMVINSIQHFERYHPEEIKKIDKKILDRLSIPLTEEVIGAFSDEMLMWIMAGIGVYSVKHMTEYQRNIIMKLYPKLAFLCSDKSIVFGTNLPNLTNIFIDSSFAEKESVPTLYQLMGRVGRMGRSYHANIIMNNEKAVDKILSFHDNLDERGVDHHSIDLKISTLLH